MEEGQRYRLTSSCSLRVGAKRRRAFGLRPVPSSTSRPFGVNPSRLRACGAARSACGEGRASLQWSGLVGLRPGLLRQVVRKRAFLDAGGSLPVRHEGRFTDTPSGLDMELPCHASSMWPRTAGILSARGKETSHSFKHYHA